MKKAEDCPICGAKKSMKKSRKLVFNAKTIHIENLSGKKCSVCGDGYLGPTALHRVDEAVFSYFKARIA